MNLSVIIFSLPVKLGSYGSSKLKQLLYNEMVDSYELSLLCRQTTRSVSGLLSYDLIDVGQQSADSPLMAIFEELLLIFQSSNRLTLEH